MKKLEITSIPLWKYESVEPLGTKRKFWFTDDIDREEKLFKIGRPNTGENWAEVVTAEICRLLDIPHAEYQFAEWDDTEGTITESFVPLKGRLILGNELLSKVLEDVEYDTLKKYGLKEYTLRTIFAILKGNNIIKVPLGYNNHYVKTAFDVFVGYIILDCLISNPDRHHENWGIILQGMNLYLTPTYDHGSGLGCRELDENKSSRLTTTDNGFKIEAFVKKAKTPFYDKSSGKKLSTLETVVLCSKLNKNATLYWLDKINELDLELVRHMFKQIPGHLISGISIEFSLEILKENIKRLMVIKEELENE